MSAVYEVWESTGWEVHSGEHFVAAFGEMGDALRCCDDLGELARVKTVEVETYEHWRRTAFRTETRRVR